MTYLRNEQIYRDLMARFSCGLLHADEFMKLFMEQWNSDRDEQWTKIHSGESIARDEQVLSAILDQVFTACDCYTSAPSAPTDISAEQFQAEVAELFSSSWGAEC